MDELVDGALDLRESTPEDVRCLGTHAPEVPSMVRQHVATEHELRRAREAAQTLAERLEMAGMDADAAFAREIRNRVAARLAILETA